MKRFVERVIDKGEQLAEILALVLVAIVPSVLDIQSIIAPLDAPQLDALALLAYYAAKWGNVGIGCFLTVCFLLAIRRRNRDRVINRGNLYHEHGMLWYWFCSKVLDYRTCSLVLVPIAMQFKLVIHDVFEEFVFGEIADADSTDVIEMEWFHAEGGLQGHQDRVNILISDTYPCGLDLLPSECRGNDSVVLQRTANEKSQTRCASPRLVDAVTNVVRQLPEGTSVNIFATTNPKNTYMIANKVFKTGARDNLRALYVYKQPRKSQGWRFEGGVRIYDRT